MPTVDSNVFCIPSVPTRYRTMADFLNLGLFDGIGDLGDLVDWRSQGQRE